MAQMKNWVTLKMHKSNKKDLVNKQTSQLPTQYIMKVQLNNFDVTCTRRETERKKERKKKKRNKEKEKQQTNKQTKQTTTKERRKANESTQKNPKKPR